MSTRLDLVGLVVADMARSLAFYRELGFEFAADAEQKPHVEATLSGGIRLAWDTIEEIHTFDPDWEQPSGDSRIGLAFLVETPSDVDATYERLVAAGYDGHKEPWDVLPGGSDTRRSRIRTETASTSSARSSRRHHRPSAGW